MNEQRSFDDVARTADRYIRCNQRDRAIAEYEKWLVGNPEDWRTIKLAAELNVQLGRNEDAIRHNRRLAWHFKNVSDEGIKKANAIYRIIIRLDPSDEDVKEQLSRP